MRSVRTRLLLTAAFGLLMAPGTAAAAFTSTGSLAAARTQAGATALPNAAAPASVLVTGGYDASSPAAAPLDSAERYSIATGAWTPADTMSSVRVGHHSILLPSGSVLVVGGLGIRGTANRTVDTYDPVADAWDPGAAMVSARSEEEANLVTGRGGATEVVVTGGNISGAGPPVPSTNVETYDVAGDQWITTPSMTTARASHASVTLPDGRILVTGGFTTGGAPTASTEIFNPVTRVWSAGPPMSTPRARHTLSVVDATHVVAVGGVSTAAGLTLASAESYNPAANAWSAAGSMAVARNGQAETVVRDGWLVITGGRNASSPAGLDSAEQWTPANGWGGLYALPGPTSIGSARIDHVAAAIPASDEVLVAGGGVVAGNAPSTVTATASRWRPDQPAVVPPSTPPATTPLQEPPPPPPVPVESRTLIAAVITGDVFVRIGNTDEYRELLPGEPIPVGTVLDTTDGRVQLVAAVGGGRQTAWFWGGTFTVLQPKNAGGYVEIRLYGKPTCKKPSSKKKAVRAVKRKKKPKVWGDGKGKFRTKGVNSTASVRGTKWLVEERCTGTFTKVERGRVSVRDFGRHKTVIVKAGKNYLARPRR